MCPFIPPPLLIRASLGVNIEESSSTREQGAGSWGTSNLPVCRVSTVYCLLSNVYCIRSAVYCLLSTVIREVVAGEHPTCRSVECLLSTVYCLMSTVYCLLSTIYCLQGAGSWGTSNLPACRVSNIPTSCLLASLRHVHTAHNVQVILHFTNLHYTLNTAHCTVHSVQYTLHTTHCALHSAHFTWFTSRSAHCTWCTSHAPLPSFPECHVCNVSMASHRNLHLCWVFDLCL